MIKKGTISTRKHRFESFNQRIAKLNIDPIRRVRRTDIEANDIASTTSFLQAGLERWRDLNLSENFAVFLHEAEPLCQSLPQILHYQQDIMAILITYIEKRDPLSLEPLLDLLARFAHDLGIRFESHFAKAVAVVASVAAKHTDVQVIEWSFSCLAWLFKYLSRLLLPDLRPLYTTMAPLLGREPQKLYTTRFAAEAMSFLLRKAALLYPKNPKPLDLIISYILDDLVSTAEQIQRCHLYQHGVMTLIVESIKGIDRRLHSSGAYLYRCLLERILDRGDSPTPTIESVLLGVTVALVHHTDAANFSPILDVVYEDIRKRSTEWGNSSVSIYGRLLFIIITVRKATRIHDWLPVFDALAALLEQYKESTSRNIPQVFYAAAAIIQAAPLEIVIPKVRSIMNTIASDQNIRYFVPFCNFFCDLDQDRFQYLLLPYFSKFVLSHWKEDEFELLLSLPKVLGETQDKKLICPNAWQQHIVKTFKEVQTDNNLVTLCSAYLESFNCMSMAASTINQVIGSLGDLIQKSVQSPFSNDWRMKFSIGHGLKSYLQYSSHVGFGLSDTLPQILSLASQYGTLPMYLEAVHFSVEANHHELAGNVIESVVNVLIKNLRSSHHILRNLSLQILRDLLVQTHDEQKEILTVALAIENSPLDLQSSRSVSMHIRKLSSLYESASSHAWIQDAIPNFCFGLLTYRLAQVWDDAINALKEISDTTYGEAVVSDIAFRWFEESQDVSLKTPLSKQEHTQAFPLTIFQCSNLIRVENLLETIASEKNASFEHINQKFAQSHQPLTRKVDGASALALRVFLGIPWIAEKHSRQLVPQFLRWAVHDLRDEIGESLKDPEASMEHQKLPHKNRKAMLELFCSFTNPRVLYQSLEVFDALRNQLANGDIEMQRFALKAIFTWKIPGIQPYQENLMNLLDDSRFREEISIFLHDDNAIRAEHRPDLVPVLLRILYGKIIAGKGVGTGKRGQAVTRRVVFEALSRFKEKDLGEFIQIILGSLANLDILQDFHLAEGRVSQSHFNARKQVGFVHMTKDMLETLGGQIAPYARQITEALLYCLIKATRELTKTELDAREASQTSLFKAVRQVGMQCLTLIFRHCPSKEMEPYMSTIFVELISPRLQRLPVETAQSVSGLLQLFSTWASSLDTVSFLADYDPSLMSRVVDCLDVPSAKEEVKLYILEEILKKIINLCNVSTAREYEMDGSSKEEVIVQKVLRRNMDMILGPVGGLLRKSPSKEILGSTIGLVSSLAPWVTGSSQAGNLLEISTFLLDQPSHRVNPRIKGDLLQILQNFLPLAHIHSLNDLQDRIFRTISSLFGYFKDQTNRWKLSQVLTVLAAKDSELEEVAGLCTSLNSFLPGKLDEPDFDERLKAFNTVNEMKYQNFSPKQWRPLLYNMLYYIKDTEELAIRSNASFALRRFVETNKFNEGDGASVLVKLILLPAIRKGAFEPSELVRAEYLGVMAHLVRHNPGWEEINDMYVLLVIEDEEASFFGNVLHIQQHRRLRALRRLANGARQFNLHSVNVAHFFMPLIEHFIFNKAEDESAHNLAAETILAIGALASSLEWSQFRAMFRRYNSYILSKPNLEKTIIRLLGVIIDTLGQAAEVKKTRTSEANEENAINGISLSLEYCQSNLSATLPKPEKLTGDLADNLLPLLLKYLHDKDESTVSLRVPMAVSTVKLLMLLPSDRMKDLLPAVLTDVCNILRSRSQESRDMTRKTLVEIATLIGPQCFGFVLKELRSALARGYQLHVLSFTVHSILVAIAPIFKVGDSDYCLPQIVSIIMDDIFGATGLEKDAEEYISKMKEVKSSKSYDSMELISKTVLVENFVHLIRPLQVLLEEKLDLKMVKKIDELFRRVTVGLLQNEAMQDRQVLVFCHEIIREVYQDGGSFKERTSRDDHRNKRFLVNSKGASKSTTGGSTSSYRYKLVRFSLDVLRSVLGKYDNLRIPANISGFIPIISDAITESCDEVQISALRLLATIIKVPVKEIDENAGNYLAACVKIFKASVSTNSELTQAALKLVSAILRERRGKEIKETDLAYLLKRLIPDLEQPDRQGVVFNFLKAVMARKVVIAEVYEVLDAVTTIMVTNQTRGARDLARGVYFQFLMEYPQGKARFSKQLSFLIRNLDYKHQEGRQSVMEVIHLLFLKVGEDMIQDIIESFMVPLVMVMVNDESATCREMAGVLLKTSFERADAKRTKSFLTLLRTWLDQSEQPLLVRAALQLHNLYLNVDPKKSEKELPFLHSHIAQILKGNLAGSENAEWELLYFALQTFTKITQLYSNSAFTSKFAPVWASIRQILSFPHAWVKLSAANLLGAYYADFARKNADAEELALPLQGSGGLWLRGDEIVGIASVLLASLQVTDVSEELANQSVRILIFLGRIMGKTSLLWQPTEQQIENELLDDDADDSEDETSEPSSGKTALAFVIERASALIRKGPLTTRALSLIPLKASLVLLTALCTHIPLRILTPHLQTVLLPLHNLTDSAIAAPFSTDDAFTATYKALVSNSAETMALLQKRMGTTEYVRLLARVREGVKERREGRKAKRRIGAVAEPERREKEKRKKGERKRERRKERGGEERGRRRGW